MISIIFLAWYFGAHVNAYLLTEKLHDVLFDSDEEWQILLPIIAVSMIWPYYQVSKLLDSVHVNLLPGPGEIA